MMTTDAAFLEEVEDFLVSFDLPSFVTLHTITDDENSDDALPTSTVAATPLDSTATTKAKRMKKAKQVLDAASKHELQKAKDRKRRSIYRERRKVEKETLQQQVTELTTELTELQKNKEAERSLASSAWEKVAKRQLQGRVNAEEKQRRLIQAIESRGAMIQEFQSVMSDNPPNEVDTVELGEMGFKHKRIRLEPSDAEFYEAYAKQLEVSYAQTDEVLKTYELDSMDASWDHPKRQWKEDGETGYYVYADKNLLPFDFQQVCRFTWRVAQLQHRQEDREHYAGMGNPENTAAFKFRVTTRLNSGRTVSVMQRAVIRRYLRDDRSVVVWRSFSEGEGMFAGMHADEAGWCVSVPLPSSSEPSTLTRTMIRHVPMHFSSKAAHESDAAQFTGFVLDTGTEDAREIGSRLEKLLLEDK